MFTQSINFYKFYFHIIKECRCLKNVIWQIDRNKWLFLLAFQQSLRQNWSWFLSWHRKAIFRRVFILKITERALVLLISFQYFERFMQHFHTKLLCQKLMLRQIEWGVQNGPWWWSVIYLGMVLQTYVTYNDMAMLRCFIFFVPLSFKVNWVMLPYWVLPRGNFHAWVIPYGCIRCGSHSSIRYYTYPPTPSLLPLCGYMLLDFTLDLTYC